MITFETSFTLTISLLIGYISIIVSTYEKSSSKKDSNQPKVKKINIYVSVFFALCLIIVWVLHFVDNSLAISVIRQVAVPLQHIINFATPIKGSLFSNDDFISVYCSGLAILDLPIIICSLESFWKKEKSISAKVLGIICILFSVVIISVWVEYYLAFSVYSTFAEFSSIHCFIASAVLNFIIMIVVIVLITE